MGGYTKLFSEIVTSSIWSEDDTTRLVWITMLALVDGPTGFVPAAVPGIANAARVPLDKCERALEKLMAPDQYSRSTDNDGRRIERVEGGFLILNYSRFRDRVDLSKDPRKVYQREWARQKRSRQSVDVESTDSRIHASASASVATEEEGCGEKKPKKARPAFEKPAVADVLAYCTQRNNGVDAEAFVAFYESKGWRVGNQPMKDWKAAVVTWEKRRVDAKPAASQTKASDFRSSKDRWEWQKAKENEEHSAELRAIVQRALDAGKCFCPGCDADACQRCWETVPQLRERYVTRANCRKMTRKEGE